MPHVPVVVSVLYGSSPLVCFCVYIKKCMFYLCFKMLFPLILHKLSEIWWGVNKHHV